MIAAGLDADSNQIATQSINQKHCRKDILFHEGSFALTKYFTNKLEYAKPKGKGSKIKPNFSRKCKNHKKGLGRK